MKFPLAFRSISKRLVAYSVSELQHGHWVEYDPGMNHAANRRRVMLTFPYTNATVSFCAHFARHWSLLYNNQLADRLI